MNIRKILFIILIALGAVQAFARQGNHNEKLDSALRNRAAHFNKDSLLMNLSNRKVQADSIRNRFSIRYIFKKRKKKLDSLGLVKVKRDDQLSAKGKGEIDSIKRSFTMRLDSLRANTPDKVLAKKRTDSLTAAYDKVLNGKVSILRKNGIKLPKSAGKLSDQNQLVAGNLPAMPNAKIPGMGDLPGSDLNLPNADLPKLDIPGASMPEGKPLNTDVPQLDQVKKPELPGELGKAKDVVEDASGRARQAAGLEQDAERLKSEGINSKEATELVDGAVENAKPLKNITKQLSEAEKSDQLKQLEAIKIKDAQSARDKLASKAATDKLLQNEQAVKTYMEKMGKKKKKFDQISDMRYVPKIKPNEMKDKPLKERLVPGMLFQVLESGQTRISRKTISWFLAPELLYRISGKISVGAGGVYRLQYSMSPKVIWDQPLYGYKLIGQVKTWKNFYVRTEWENLSFYFPSAAVDGQKRIWQNNLLAGAGRVQPISGRLNGYLWAFYNVTRDPSDIFRNRVILKTGIQFTIVNNHKKLVSHVAEKMKSQRKNFKDQKAKIEPAKH